MVFCSLQDAYGKEWKNTPNTGSMTPCQSSNFTTQDPYFDDQVQSGILDKLEKLENQIEYFTHKAAAPKKSFMRKERFTASNTTVSPPTSPSTNTNNGRLENIIHYTLIAIFGALVVENVF